MNIENIKRMARNGFEVERRAISQLKHMAVCIANEGADSVNRHSWCRRGYDDTFFCYLPMFAFGEMPVFRFKELEASHDGVHVKMYYDMHEQCNEYYVFIKAEEVPDDTSAKRLLDALNNRRRELMHDLLNRIGENALVFLKKHEEEICKYPVVHSCDMGGLSYKNFIIWACGSNDDENEMMHRKESKEMQQLLFRKFCYSSIEHLDNADKFIPCVFSNDEQLESRFRLNQYVDLIISRNSGYHDDMVMYTPALYARFIIKNGYESFTPAFSAAVKASELHYQREQETHFREFVKDFDDAEWTIEENLFGVEQAVAYIPIIWVDYLDNILAKAKMLYPSDIFDFERSEMVCSIFSNDHSENEEKHPCIKVTIK